MAGKLILRVPGTVVPPDPGSGSLGLMWDAFGPYQTVPQMAAQGGTVDAYQAKYALYEPLHQTRVAASSYHEQGNSPDFFGGAVYDRAMTQYVWAEMVAASNPSLATTYRSHASSLAPVVIADLFSSYNNEPWQEPYTPASYWLYAANSNARQQIGNFANYIYYLRHGGYISNYYDGSHAETSQRIQAHALANYMMAVYLSAPNNGSWAGVATGNNFATDLPLLVADIIGMQSADGGWRYPNNGVTTHPFQVGLLCGRLISYARLFNQHNLIFPIVKLSHSFLWTDLLGPDRFFHYGEDCDWSSNPVPFDFFQDTTDTNLFHISSFGYLYWCTGDQTYLDRGDALLAKWNEYNDNAAVTDKFGIYAGSGANESNYKRFSEAYLDSFRYPYWRALAPANTHDQGVPKCTAAPTISGTAANGQTLTCNPGTYSPAATTITRQWKRVPEVGVANTVAKVNIGTNSTTYAVSGASGTRIWCVETPSNASGTGPSMRTPYTALIS